MITPKAEALRRKPMDVDGTVGPCLLEYQLIEGENEFFFFFFSPPFGALLVVFVGLFLVVMFLLVFLTPVEGLNYLSTFANPSFGLLAKVC